MTKENLPEQYHIPRKKERIPSKKRFKQFAEEFKEIDPQMDPEEVIRRTKQYIEGPNPNKSEDERKKEELASALRKERLQSDGLNPTEWTYYGIGNQPKAGWDTPFTEDDKKIARLRLPDGIDLLVSRGHIIPASEPDRRHGEEFYVVKHFWEMFIRIKPNTETPPSQIESPQEPKL